MTHAKAINQAHDERHPFCIYVLAADFFAVIPYYMERMPQ
jgi:hypothetical protein